MAASHDFLYGSDIRNDGGGYVDDYMARLAADRQNGTQIRVLPGASVRSAGTLVLGIDPEHLYVAKDSIFKFHLARDERTGQPNMEYTNRMLAAYPQAVREQIANTPGGLKNRAYNVVLSGDWMIQHHLARPLEEYGRAPAHAYARSHAAPPAQVQARNQNLDLGSVFSGWFGGGHAQPQPSQQIAARTTRKNAYDRAAMRRQAAAPAVAEDRRQKTAPAAKHMRVRKEAAEQQKSASGFNLFGIHIGL